MAVLVNMDINPGAIRGRRILNYTSGYWVLSYDTAYIIDGLNEEMFS